MTALPKNWRPHRQRPMSHLSVAARLKRSTQRYGAAAARKLQRPADKMHDPVEIVISEGGAGGDDDR